MPRESRPPHPTHSVCRAAWRALRPAQWTKNAVVLVPFFFAFWDARQSQALILSHLGNVLLAVLCFCMASSGVYLFNDLCDLEQDRAHPLKRNRPIAAGQLSIAGARFLLLLLLASALALSFRVNLGFRGMLAAYVILQAFYSLGLKRVGLLDVFVIAFGFVLRAVAGAFAADAMVSPWLLLCTFLLALFLALCKRRHEKFHLPGGGGEHREVLDQYDLRALDQFIGIAATSTVVSYAIYTLSPDTVSKFGTRGLCFTVPFVMFGVFRYLDLLYRRSEGDRPEKVLLTDPPLMLTIVLYLLSAWAAFQLGRVS